MSARIAGPQPDWCEDDAAAIADQLDEVRRDPRGELSAKAPYTRLPPPKVDLSLFGKAIQILGHPWSEVLSFVLPRIAEISCFQCSQYCFRFRHGERLPLSRPSGLCCNFGRRRLATCDFDNVKGAMLKPFAPERGSRPPMAGRGADLDARTGPGPDREDYRLTINGFGAP